MYRAAVRVSLYPLARNPEAIPIILRAIRIDTLLCLQSIPSGILELLPLVRIFFPSR
jgi:hypothetical protein